MNMNERKRHVFYNKETGRIYSVIDFTHSQAEENCKGNAKFKMTCKPESDIGRVTNWTQGADSPLSDAKKLEWQTYRQTLRDITFQQYMNWPLQPQ